MSIILIVLALIFLPKLIDALKIAAFVIIGSIQLFLTYGIIPLLIWVAISLNTKG